MSTDNEYDSGYEMTMRNIKIKLALGEYVIGVENERYEKFKKSREYKVYKETHNGKAITGSMALYLFGLLDRTVGDLDIMNSDIKKFNFSHRDSYDFIENDSGYLGSVMYIPKWYQFFENFHIDIFEETEIEKIVYKDLVIDNPLSIMENKKIIGDIGNRKHYSDLKFIQSKFNNLI